MYLGLYLDDQPNFAIFRFVRVLRLIRILRAFRLLSGLSGVKRQLITLVLTLLSLIFLASGIVHLMENDVRQQYYLDCNYLVAAYNETCQHATYSDGGECWLPSCHANNLTYFNTEPYDYTVDDPNYCDCQANSCSATYARRDPIGLLISIYIFVQLLLTSLLILFREAFCRYL